MNVHCSVATEFMKLVLSNTRGWNGYGTLVQSEHNHVVKKVTSYAKTNGFMNLKGTHTIQ
jgi:hypothetical protein